MLSSVPALAQETALGVGALVVVGREKSVLERSVGVDPVLVVGIFIDDGRIGTDHGRHTRRKPVGVLGLLLDLFPREVAQRVVRRASLAEINQVLAVVVTVKQAHATCVAGGNPFENLLDDRPGVEALGIGIERILPQSGYQTVVILVEHGARLKRYTAFYRPCRAGTPSTERRNPGPKTKCSSRRLWHPP